MSDASFARPDLTTFCRLDELGLQIVGQHLEPDRAVLASRVIDVDEADRWFVELAPPSTSEFFDTAVWTACLT